MNCYLCYTFLHDHVDSSLTLTFKSHSSRLTSSLHFQDFVRELLKVYATCIAHRTFYEIILDQLDSMEVFNSHEETVSMFYTSQPLMSNLVSHLECMMFDAGLGKLSDIQMWLHHELFTLFKVMLQMHRQHTKEVPPKELGAPLLYRPPTHEKPVLLMDEPLGKRNIDTSIDEIEEYERMVGAHTI